MYINIYSKLIFDFTLKMSEEKIQYVDGSRNSTLLLYKNYLYCKYNGDYWKCRHADCGRLIKVVGEKVVGVEPVHPMHF